MDAGNESTERFAVLDESVCSDSDIAFVVAFGSRTTDEATRTSDLDLAVKFTNNLSKSDRFNKRCFLSGNLQREDTPFIDVSDIESLPLDAAHDAVNGVFICGDEDTFEQFRTDVEDTFAEQRDDLRRQQRAVIDRIAEDGLRG